MNLQTAAHPLSATRELIIEPHLLSDADCGSLIATYEIHVELSHKRDYCGNRVLHYHDLDAFPQEQSALQRIVSAVIRVLQRVPSLGALYVESVFLTMLPPGGHHPAHADNERYNGNQWVPNHTPHRDYSAIVYLNSDFVGGELWFEDLAFCIRPVEGLLIAFPSDHRFVHRVDPVTAGRRYSVPLWFTKEESRSLQLRSQAPE